MTVKLTGTDDKGAAVTTFGTIGQYVGGNIRFLRDAFTGVTTLLGDIARLVRDAGARRVLTAVFAAKPWPTPRAIEPDFVAWQAPARFLVGYGMDDAGKHRGLPYVGAMD